MCIVMCDNTGALDPGYEHVLRWKRRVFITRQNHTILPDRTRRLPINRFGVMLVLLPFHSSIC